MRKMTGSQIDVIRFALIASRSIVQETLEQTISSYSFVETKPRRGSIPSCVKGYWHNADTIDEIGAMKDVKQCRRALKQIDAALGIIT